MLCVLPVQKLELQKANQDDGETVRGQIVISLISRDRGGGGGGGEVAVPDVAEIPREPDELPEG